MACAGIEMRFSRKVRNAVQTALILVLTPFLTPVLQAQTLKVSGSPAVSFPMADAAKILKEERKIVLEIDTEGESSSRGIMELGLEDSDIAMSSRAITGEDRAHFPSLNLTEIYLGEEATAIIVSPGIWSAGVRMITRLQARGIYEGKITNWKELGGPYQPIIGYTPDQSRGVWACYERWIYEDPAKVRPNRFALTSSDEETQACVETTPGAIAQVYMRFAERKGLHTLAIVDEGARVIQPGTASLASHAYPMSRPILLIVRNRPLATIKTVVEFMLSDRGQDLVHKHDFYTLKDLGLTPQTFD